MNRIWVRLWLGIVMAGVGSFVCFTLSALLIYIFYGDNPTADTEAALILLIVGLGGTILLSMLIATFIARRLARPLAAVSDAARRVAGGDLKARATQRRPLRHVRQRLRGYRKRVMFYRNRLIRQPPNLGPRSKRQGRRRRAWMSRQRQQRRKGKSEAQRLLEDFNVMAVSLERLETERQATTAAIAHDLRTPLTILWGRLAGARDGLIELDAAEITLLIGQIELLTRMVEDLRTLSLAEAGRLSLRLSVIDVSDLVERVVLGYAGRAAEKVVTLTVSVTPEISLEADPDRIQQILVNLLDNALRFTPAAGQVGVSLKGKGQSAVLSVRDTGPGIGEEALKHIFKRFYREDSARSSAGTGLGLAIVHSLVSLHGGTVTARNHERGGAVLEVVLPRLEA